MPRRGFLRTVDRCTQGQTKPLYLVPDAKFLSLAPLRGFARCNQVLRSAAFANSQYEGTGSPRFPWGRFTSTASNSGLSDVPA